MTSPADTLRRDLIAAHCAALIATLTELAHPVPRDSEKEGADIPEKEMAHAVEAA